MSSLRVLHGGLGSNFDPESLTLTSLRWGAVAFTPLPGRDREAGLSPEWRPGRHRSTPIDPDRPPGGKAA